MWANLFAHWGLGLPLAWVLAVMTPLGAPGVWLGLTGSLTVVAAVLVLRFTRGRWRALGPVTAPEPVAT
jgi:Na+-driven multidrug efflux pump